MILVSQLKDKVILIIKFSLIYIQTERSGKGKIHGATSANDVSEKVVLPQ